MILNRQNLIHGLVSFYYKIKSEELSDHVVTDVELYTYLACHVLGETACDNDDVLRYGRHLFDTQVHHPPQGYLVGVHDITSAYTVNL